MQSIDQFLNSIEDGAWYSLKKLSKRLDTPNERLVALINVLAEANIVEYKNHESKVRLRHEWRHMLRSSNKEDHERMAVGTIVLPPKKSIDIQNIQITNLTEKELELGVRINKKLKELAIGMLK